MIEISIQSETDLQRIIDKGVILADVKIFRGKREEFRANRRVRVIDDTAYKNCLLSFDGDTYSVMSPFDSIFRVKKSASMLEVILVAVLFLYGFVSTFINIELLTDLRYEFSVSHGFALFVASAMIAFASWALSKIQVRVISLHEHKLTNVYFAENDPHFNEQLEEIDVTNPKAYTDKVDDLTHDFDFDITNKKETIQLEQPKPKANKKRKKK
ncbi:MAG: hypothetical protein GWN00_22820 [Aliifodinibius sp.]|nr:hypothetical protein [Fodinibius sp.]NIV13751.1 hypothetical protein [Fodinibius sp.]NIY27533.1 hypothetical protein [Fodinibius sp.]